VYIQKVKALFPIWMSAETHNLRLGCESPRFNSTAI